MTQNAKLFATYVIELRASGDGFCSGYRTNLEDDRVSNVNLISDPEGNWIVHKQLDPELAAGLLCWLAGYWNWPYSPCKSPPQPFSSSAEKQ